MTRLKSAGCKVVPPNRTVTKRTVTVDGRKTSLTLGHAFWNAVRTIAHQRGISAADLVSEINRTRGKYNLSSDIRIFLLDCMSLARES